MAEVYKRRAADFAEDNGLHGDIREIRGLVIDALTVSKANGSTLEALEKRLFVDGSGALPAMWKEIGKAKDAAADAAAAVVKVDNKLKTQRAWVAGFSAAGMLFGGAIKTFLTKAGLNF